MCFTKRKRKNKLKDKHKDKKRTTCNSKTIIIQSKEVQPKRTIKKITP